MNVPGIVALVIAIILGSACALTARFRVPGALVLASAAVFTIRVRGNEERWCRRFRQVQDNASMEDVIREMGPPTIISDDTTAPSDHWLREENHLVTREIWYVPFFGGQRYAFGFDRDGHLIERRR
ncbi:MAG: hypothetical protein IT577_05970 [Verrucomicrobiae bacterium]|nr:hypothetical protein [Verrucomicrobiae bacterium]